MLYTAYDSKVKVLVCQRKLQKGELKIGQLCFVQLLLRVFKVRRFRGLCK